MSTYNVLPSEPSTSGKARGNCAWAERPMTYNSAGDTLRMSDRDYTEYVWTGTEWTDPYPYSLAAHDTSFLIQSGVPVIIPTDGTVATDGAITLGTALPTTYARAWVYLPEGAMVDALAAALPAGFYFTLFSSDTVGIVTTSYIDPAAAFTAAFPTASVVTGIGSNAAYVVPPTVDYVLARAVIPAATMGITSALRAEALWSVSNSANAKGLKLNFGNMVAMSTTTTTELSVLTKVLVSNAGNLISQKGHLAGSTGAVVRGAVDTAAAVTVTLTGKPHTTDAGAGCIVLEAYSLELRP